MEGAYCGGTIIQRITDRGHGQPWIETDRWIDQLAPGPAAEAGIGQRLPGKAGARIDLAGRGQVRMADYLRTRDAQARTQVVQQPDDRGDLRVGVGFAAFVVDLDANRCRIQVRDRAPRAATRLPGALAVVDQLVDVAVVANQIMRTDLATAIGGAQGVEALLHRLLLGGVQDNDDGTSLIEVRRRHPARHRVVGGWCMGTGAQQSDARKQGNDQGFVHGSIEAARAMHCN